LRFSRATPGCIPAPAEHFVLLSGTLKTYIEAAESGNKRLHAFCGNCGTPIYASSLEDACLAVSLRRWPPFVKGCDVV
jgi:hypothetical protein